MWAVIDNGKPASNEAYKHAGSEYNNHLYPTFNEALTYARKWLGHWDKIPLDVKEGDLKIQISFGDFLEIKNLDITKEVIESAEAIVIVEEKDKIKEARDLQYKLKRIVENCPERQWMRIGTEKVVAGDALKDTPFGDYQFLIDNKGYTLSYTLTSEPKSWKLVRIS